MEISNQKKLSKHIFRLLKVTDITYPIGRTSKGNLGIRFTENGEDFDIMLDSIPLSIKDIMTDDNNIELKKMLDKYLFDSVTLYPMQPLNFTPEVVKELSEMVDDTVTEIDLGEEGGLVQGTYEVLKVPVGTIDRGSFSGIIGNSGIEESPTLLKKRGRPAGSKNAPKEINTNIN